MIPSVPQAHIEGSLARTSCEKPLRSMWCLPADRFGQTCHDSMSALAGINWQNESKLTWSHYCRHRRVWLIRRILKLAFFTSIFPKSQTSADQLGNPLLLQSPFKPLLPNYGLSGKQNRDQNSRGPEALLEQPVSRLLFRPLQQSKSLLDWMRA